MEGQEGTAGNQGACGTGLPASRTTRWDKRVSWESEPEMGDLAFKKSVTAGEPSTWSQIGQIYVNNVDSMSVEALKAMVYVGSEIKIYDSTDEENVYGSYRITTWYVDYGTYWKVNVDYVESSGSLPPVGNLSPALKLVQGAEHEGKDGESCFIAGTKITVPGGETKNIEDIKDGDEVMATVFGPLKNDTTVGRSRVVGKVYGYVEHGLTEVIKINHTGTGDSIVCTPNHYIFSPDGTFKESKNFKVGEKLVDYKTHRSATITSIEQVEDQKTYNFEVDPFRNYVANNLVVHNGALGKVTAAEGPYGSNQGYQLTYTEDGQWETMPQQHLIYLKFNETGNRNNADGERFYGIDTEGTQGGTFSDVSTFEDISYIMPATAQIVDVQILSHEKSTLKIGSMVMSISEIHPSTGNMISATRTEVASYQYEFALDTTNQGACGIIRALQGCVDSAQNTMGDGYWLEKGRAYQFSFNVLSATFVPSHTVHITMRSDVSKPPFLTYAD